MESLKDLAAMLPAASFRPSTVRPQTAAEARIEHASDAFAEFGSCKCEHCAIKCEAIDPATGLVVRAATESETLAWLAQPERFPGRAALSASFRVAVQVGDLMINEDTGPGRWFGGAGF